MDEQKNDVTFSKVREAIEIADRIERLKTFVHQRKKDLICTIGATRAVCVERNELQDYFHLEQIDKILYLITKDDDNWTAGRCCGEICGELRQ